MSQKGVVFIQAYGNYVTRDVAFFDEATAANLIRSRIARSASEADIAKGREVEAPKDSPAPEARDDMIPLKFDRTYGPYNIGEIAYFPPIEAERILIAGVGHKPKPKEMAAVTKATIARQDGARRVAVRLLRQVMPNNKGETVWVPLETARWYLEKGIAELAEPAPEGLFPPGAEDETAVVGAGASAAAEAPKAPVGRGRS